MKRMRNSSGSPLLLLLLLVVCEKIVVAESSHSNNNNHDKNSNPLSSSLFFQIQTAVQSPPPSSNRRSIDSNHHRQRSSSKNQFQWSTSSLPERQRFRGGSSPLKRTNDNNKQMSPPHPLSSKASSNVADASPSSETAATTTSHSSTRTFPKIEKWMTYSVASFMLVSVVYAKREALAPLLDKHYIQEKTLAILGQLQDRPGSLYLYMLGMAAWELLGLSTIPVETAAGMVFGFRRGFLASGSGKLLGACTAFALGRYGLAQRVRTKLDQNPLWKTLDRSTDVHSPMKVALLMKFSCFPELIKNCGSSCLTAVSFGTFTLATGKL